MIGLPHQTLNDLAGDLLFFKEMDVDMIGYALNFFLSEITHLASF